MKLSKREKQLLSILIALLIFTCYYFIVYRPMIEDIEVMTLEMDAMTTRLSTSQSNKQQLPALRKQLDDLTREMDTAFDEIPQMVGEQELVVYLYETIKPLAHKTSLVIEPPVEGTQYNSAIFNISLETSYQNFKSILKLLDTSKYNDIISFTINSKALNHDTEDAGLSQGNNYNIIVNMSIEFFYILEKDREIEGYPYIKGIIGAKDPFKGN